MSTFDLTAAATVYSGRRRIYQPSQEGLDPLVRRPAANGSEASQSRAPPRDAQRPASKIDRMRDPLTPADVAGALAGDDIALNRLVEHLTPVIQSRVAALLLRSAAGVAGGLRSQVEDLVQEVFIVLFDKNGATLQSWDPARGTTLESFVGVVAQRRVISILRSGRKNPWKEESALPEELDALGSDAGSEKLVASRELLSEVLQRLEAELRPQGWRIFQLLFVQQLSVPEISRETDLSADAIYAWRSRLRRLARRLRQEIETEKTPQRRQKSSRWRHIIPFSLRLIFLSRLIR